MSAKSAINKEVFAPHDEKMLGAVQVKRRMKKKIPFLATGGQGDYMTFICLSGNVNSSGSFSFLEWFIIKHNKTLQVVHCCKNDSVATGDGCSTWLCIWILCIYIYVLSSFMNIPLSAVISEQSTPYCNSILHSAADSVTSAVQKASQALNERGERLGRTEEKTGEMMNSAQQFADTAHKVRDIICIFFHAYP
ncbi:syntaxin-binding protein 6 [Huso huso]|uniref:Syntaxin-binding protein 6 n=1 Tax=Huso huso TaxID=61971 RepID=A0ABR0Z8Z6_HUSHU